MGLGKQLSILSLASGLCLGEGPDSAMAVTPPVPTARTEAYQGPAVPDLDFSNDFTAPMAVIQPQPTHADSSFLRAISRPWVFWTLGASAAAAGSMAWFLHSYQDATPAVRRTEQVFTDEP